MEKMRDIIEIHGGVKYGGGKGHWQGMKYQEMQEQINGLKGNCIKLREGRIKR